MALPGMRQRLSFAAVGTGGSRRLLIITVGTMAIAGGAYYFFAPAPMTPVSGIPAPPRGTVTVQGGQVPSNEMSENLGKADKDRLEAAATQGASAMPTVTAKLVEPVKRPADDVSRLTDDDRVQRPAPPIVERPPVPPPSYPMPAPIQVASNEPDRMVDDFRKALEFKSEKWAPASVQYLFKGQMPGKPDLTGVQAQVAPLGAAAAAVGIPGIKIPLPGTIVYAQMVSSANSDTPGPVVATIVEGDLAGATLIGSFQTQREGLYISFKTLSMKRGRDGEEINKAISINAVAVDSANVGTGVATDVDYHLLQNVGVATAAAFAQGLGQAIATSGQVYSQGAFTGTTVINPTRTLKDQLYIAGGTAGGAAGQAIQRAYGNRPTTVTVAAGTPVGILFLPSSGIQ